MIFGKIMPDATNRKLAERGQINSPNTNMTAYFQ